MRYIDEFRDRDAALRLSDAIARAVRPGATYRFMEFCGGHTHAISRYGVADLLPPGIRLVHGPGCPVCVLPIGRIDQAIRLATDHGVLLASYGDTLRVPASGRTSLLRARGRGADVAMVTSPLDALDLARRRPDRHVTFLAIGFETTTAPTAAALRTAAREGLTNFTILANHVLTPPAMRAILAAGDAASVPLDGFIGPAHVSTLIGSAPYEPFARDGKPVVIAGFEPLDVMRAIQLLVHQVNEGRAQVENEFTRAVTAEGNVAAQRLVDEVFEPREAFEWRGLGTIARSALRPRATYADHDAERRFDVPYVPVADHPGCRCAAVLRGLLDPAECALFGTACTPDSPVGSCMVSAEGACAAHYRYGRFRAPAAVAAPTPAPPQEVPA